MFVSGGLLFIHTPERLLPKQLKSLRASYDWLPPFRAWTPVVLFFFLSNVFLVAVPLMPPARGYKVYDHLPYWVSPSQRLMCTSRRFMAPAAASCARRMAHLVRRGRVLVRVVCVAPAERGLRARPRLGQGRRRIDSEGRSQGRGLCIGRRRAIWIAMTAQCSPSCILIGPVKGPHGTEIV